MTAEEWAEMKTNNNYVCPRCDYPLVPVHAVEGSKRRIIALTCPEPYCDHMQIVPRGSTVDLKAARQREEALRRAAN